MPPGVVASVRRFPVRGVVHCGVGNVSSICHGGDDVCDENGLMLRLVRKRGSSWGYGRNRGVRRGEGREEAEGEVGAGAESVDELCV